MCRSLWGFSAAGLTLEWIDGPSRLGAGFCYSPGMPVIRPGLYSGAYHPQMYGKFCREVLLVEYRQYDLVAGGGGGLAEEGNENEKDGGDEAVWARIRREIFNWPEQSDRDCLFATVRAAVEANGADAVCFVVGRKVTGDIHVCAGKATFAAVVHPPIAEVAELSDITDRGGSGAPERVMRRWWGCGTLAMPGFREPVWSRGTLVQLEGQDCHEDGTPHDRFGFVWMRDEDATVLTWLDVQDSHPWVGDERV